MDGQTFKKSKKDRKKSGAPKERLGLIEDHLKEYYRRISDQLREGFQTEEEKELFLSNVFSQLAKESIKVARNQSVSVTLEKLVHLANKEQLAELLQIFIKEWEVTITDRFASYVLQALLYRLTHFLDDEDEPESLFRPLHQLSMMLLERSDLFNHTHASHVIRTLIEAMAGLTVSADIVKGKFAIKDSDKQFSSEALKEHIQYQEFADVIQALSNIIFPDNCEALLTLLSQPHTNPIAQTLLMATHAKDKNLCEEICRRVFDCGYFSVMDVECESIPSAFTDVAASFFVATYLKVARKKVANKLIRGVINPAVLDIALHPKANHVLQSALISTHNYDQFTAITENLMGHFEDLISNNKAGVLLKIAEGAVKYPEAQEQVLQEMMKAFHCSEAEDQKYTLACIATMRTVEQYKEARSSIKTGSCLSHINYLGSMIIQQLLNYEDCSVLISGLEDLSLPDHVAVTISPQGSHIYEAFLKSTSINKRHKFALAEKLQPTYFHMAMDKFGSHVVEAFWDITTIPNREKMVVSLSGSIRQLVSNQFGRKVANKFRLNDYLHQRSVWTEWFKEETRKRKLNNLDMQDAPKGKKKKKKA